MTRSRSVRLVEHSMASPLAGQRGTCVVAILCCSASLDAHAFSHAFKTSTMFFGQTTSAGAGVVSRGGRAVVLRPQPSATRLSSTVQREVNPPKGGVLDRDWTRPEASALVLPESVNGVSGPGMAATDPIPIGGSGDVEALVPVGAPTPKRKGKAPELLEGDMLENTPKMVALVYASLGLNALYLLQAISTVSSPLQALWTAAAGLAGFLVADFVSGVFHWSVDNYGDGNTPVFGTVIEAFQGHHASPWTITYRPFENNVHKICYAVLPLLALLRLTNPGSAGVALGVTFLVGSLLSQESHRYAHMTNPPAMVRRLQGLGVMVSLKEHGRHHSSPFEEKYCILNGACNGPLDSIGFFRFLERLVYELKGAEPIAWRLDPTLKEEALSTGWSPFSRRH